MTYQNALQKARSNGVLLAAHRGMAAGNIPCNTIAAFEAALRQGADMLETDLALSGDGEVLIFHPKKEKAHLNKDIHLEEMTMEQIRELRFVNIDNDKTPWGILTLDAFLETYKNRCLLNLDHGWDFMDKMVAAVRRHKMEDQVLLKAPSKLMYAEAMEELAPDMMFMPIYKETDTMTQILEKMNVNFVGAELVFATEDSALAQDDYIKSHHDKGRLLWANPLVYYYKSQLVAGHNDDNAVIYGPEENWGWLMDKGFDILQTDWILPLRQFVDNR